MNIFSRIINYLKGTKTELKHVNWPTRKQAINFTAIVIAVSLLVALFLGFFDVIFKFILERFIL
ncbi:MAG: preprotein translocase subunit SecE [Patescibacteria group bacterium]